MDNTNRELKKLIEALQKQNRSDRALQGLNESPGPDNTEQLENIAGILERIEKALTGIKVDFNLAPMTGLMEQQTSLLKSISEEQALLRKISEGSLEYDRKMGAYRNTSGREVVNKVSGKTAGKGGVVDFETARDPLAGQSKAVIERVTNNNNTTNNSTQVQAPVTPVPAMPTLSPIPGGYVPGEKSELDKSIKALIEVLKVTPKKFGQELAKSLSSYKVPEEQKTTTEKLKEVVSIYKRMGAAVLSGPKALASGIANIAKTGKSALADPKSFKEKLSSAKDSIVEKSKETFSKVSDIASAETDYTVERERFANEYAKQRQQDTTETRSEKELVKEGKEKYQKIVDKESEIASTERDLKETNRQGFTPVKSEVEKLTKLKEELKQLRQLQSQKDTRTESNTSSTNNNTNTSSTDTSSTNNNTNTSSTDTSSTNVDKKNETNSEVRAITDKDTKNNITEIVKENSETNKNTTIESAQPSTVSVTAIEPVQAKATTLLDEVKITSENSNRSSSIETKEASEEQKLQKIVKQLINQSSNTTAASNEEDDNVRSAQEILADNSKEDLELSKEALEIYKKQLDELKLIREALAPKVPKELETGTSGSKKSDGSGDEGGGGGLDIGLDVGLGRRALDTLKRGGRAIGRGAKALGAGALSLGGKLARFATTPAGKIGGAALAVGAGAYTAYKGFTGAEEEKQQELQAIDAKEKAGELTPEKASELRKEAEDKGTENKGGAIGKGTGLAAGAIGGGIAGAKVGATIGTFFGGPVGTAIGAGIGTIAGGAIGAISGSSVGQNIGGLIGKGVAGVRNFFGGKEQPGDKTKAAVTGTPSTQSTQTSSISNFSEATFAKNDTENYKKFTDYITQRTQELYQENVKKEKIDTETASAQKLKSIQNRSFADAKKEAIEKFKKEIQAAGAGTIESTVSKVSSVESAKNTTSSTSSNSTDTLQSKEINSKDSKLTNVEKTKDTLTATPVKSMQTGIAPVSITETPKEEPKGILSRISDSVKNVFSFNKDSKTSDSNTSTNTTKTSVQSVTKVEQKIGPNWQAAINSYKESTPADHLEKQYPGIGKKFVELAKKNPPRTDSLDSIQTHEEKLVTMAVNAMVNNSTTSKTEVTKSTKLTELEESRKKIAAMEQPGESAAVKKGREKTLASLDREIERERSSAAPASKDTGVKPGESVAGKGSSVPPIDPISGKSQSPGVQPVEPISGKGESTLTGKASNLRVEAQKLGLDPNSVQGTYEGGVLTKIIDKATGEEYPIDVKESDRKNVEAARNMRKLNERSGEFASVAAARQPSTGLMVNKQSTENADLNRDASTAAPALPPIISNNVSNNNNTSFVPIKPSVRPEHMGSALDRYQSRVAVY